MGRLLNASGCMLLLCSIRPTTWQRQMPQPRRHHRTAQTDRGHSFLQDVPQPHPARRRAARHPKDSRRAAIVAGCGWRAGDAVCMGRGSRGGGRRAARRAASAAARIGGHRHAAPPHHPRRGTVSRARAAPAAHGRSAHGRGGKHATLATLARTPPFHGRRRPRRWEDTREKECGRRGLGGGARRWECYWRLAPKEYMVQVQSAAGKDAASRQRRRGVAPSAGNRCVGEQPHPPGTPSSPFFPNARRLETTSLGRCHQRQRRRPRRWRQRRRRRRPHQLQGGILCAARPHPPPLAARAARERQMSAVSSRIDAAGWW